MFWFANLSLSVVMLSEMSLIMIRLFVVGIINFTISSHVVMSMKQKQITSNVAKTHFDRDSTNSLSYSILATQTTH